MSTLRPALVPTTSSPGPPPLTLQHTVRISALEPERTWKLHGDTLIMATAGQNDIPIPLQKISQVRLAFEPTRFQRNRFRCHLYNQSYIAATIQNESYKGIATFEDQSESYTEFLNTLIPRIGSLSPNAKFITGTSHLAWIGNAIFITFSFSLLLLVLFLMASAFPPLIIVKLILIAFFIPTLFRWFKRNKPSSFSPYSIPENLLPSISNLPTP
jgi:hypothetical protein